MIPEQNRLIPTGVEKEVIDMLRDQQNSLSASMGIARRRRTFGEDQSQDVRLKWLEFVRLLRAAMPYHTDFRWENSYTNTYEDCIFIEFSFPVLCLKINELSKFNDVYPKSFCRQPNSTKLFDTEEFRFRKEFEIRTLEMMLVECFGKTLSNTIRFFNDSIEDFVSSHPILKQKKFKRSFVMLYEDEYEF